MGGTLGVTLRGPNGTLHKMARWTNSISFLTDHLGFATKDQKHLDDYMKVWYEMKEDWDKHIKKCNKKDHIDCKFEQNMTPCYASHQLLAPSEYGIVLIDYPNNVVISCQHYTRLGRLSNLSLLNSRRQSNLSHDSEDQEIFNCFKDLFDNKRISSVDIRVLKKGKCVKQKYNLTGKSFEQVCDDLLKEKVIADMWLDLSPFKIYDYDKDTKQGRQDTLRHIQRLGYVLTEEEKELWKQWINWEQDE